MFLGAEQEAYLNERTDQTSVNVIREYLKSRKKKDKKAHYKIFSLA